MIADGPWPPNSVTVDVPRANTEQRSTKRWTSTEDESAVVGLSARRRHDQSGITWYSVNQLRTPW